MQSGVAVTQVHAGDRWEGWLVAVERFPIQLEVRGLVRDFIDRLTALVCLREKLAPECFLQYNQLHHENGPRRLSENGKAWMPQLGLGVWPDREPPALWTAEEFRELAPGEMIRPLMHQVFRITATAARRDALNAMFGTGVGLEMLVRQGDQELIQRTTQLLLPGIEEPSFRAFEFYVPLLEGKSLEDVDEAVLDDWLCGAQVYIRESPEDSGVLIVSSFPLVSAWREMRLTQVQGQPVWMLPIT